MTRPLRRRAPGALLLYHFAPPDAGTIMDHVSAFTRFSRFPVWAVNVGGGYPPALDRFDPAVMILHYSLFGSATYPIPPRILGFLDGSRAYKIAFFQDEYHYRPQRIAFLNDHAIDCVYTLVQPAYHELVYGAASSVRRIVTVIPGYVDDRMVRLGARWAKLDAGRRIDIGYRARRLPAHWGRGAQEKAEIGERFLEFARGTDLTLDIDVDNSSRIYGTGWYRFLGDCRSVLGVESGVSVFDMDDSIRLGTEALLAENPRMGFDELSDRLLSPFEGKLPYRTISPRHFEAAATRTVQILFEGEYSGILEPMRHYIPLKKDFGNFDDVLIRYRDIDLRHDLTHRAYVDLVASGIYTYQQFIGGVDEVMAESVGGLSRGRQRPIGLALSISQAPGMLRFRLRLAARRLAHGAWKRLPVAARDFLRPAVRRALRATIRRRRVP